MSADQDELMKLSCGDSTDCCEMDPRDVDFAAPVPVSDPKPDAEVEAHQSFFDLKAYDGGPADQRLRDFYRVQTLEQKRLMAEAKKEERHLVEMKRQKDLHARKKELEMQEAGLIAAEAEQPRVKLFGMEWFRSIGSPKYIVAPMVDQSELPYRMLTRKYGATLVYTQMFNSGIFCESAEYRRSNFDTCIGDRPLIVQFAGHDPEKLLRAAQYVEDKCDAVDINLGCPQAIAKRGRYGAYLMEELELLTAMVSILAKNLKVPVTCKTRIYHDFARSVRLCETLVNAGASLLTIHGRTREEKGHNVRACNFETIRRLKEHFKDRGIPIIANGGISDMDDLETCLKFTKCDGVMSSEGVLENPALFSRNILYTDSGRIPSTTSIPPALADPSEGIGSARVPVKYMTQLDLAEDYLDMCAKYPTWHFRTMRSHMQKFLHRYCTRHTHVRDMLSVSISVEEFRLCIGKMREIIAKEEIELATAAAEQKESEKDTVNTSTAEDAIACGEAAATAATATALLPKNSPADESYAGLSWYLRHRVEGVHLHSGRVANCKEEQMKINRKCSILDGNDDDEEGDFGMGIFSQ